MNLYIVVNRMKFSKKYTNAPIKTSDNIRSSKFIDVIIWFENTNIISKSVTTSYATKFLSKQIRNILFIFLSINITPVSRIKGLA